MKALRYIIPSLFLFLFALPAFSQDGIWPRDPEKWSDYYYVQVPLEKVFLHQRGYVVSYRSGPTALKQAYLPIEWFTETAGRGDLIKHKGGNDWPYMVIYYKDGKFSHVVLHVRYEAGHESYGALPRGIQIDDRFDVEEIVLER